MRVFGIRGRALWGAAALALAVPGAARADQFDDANKKLTDLEERVRVLGAEFRDEQLVDANAADRRVVDAELLFNLKNYSEAATILLDVIEKYPNSRAYDDALVLLGEALYQDRDYNSARRYLEMAIQKNTGSRREQQALQRLVEIALRTNNFDNVETYLGRLANIPADRLEPSVPYVRGKYLFFRDRPDDALAMLNAVTPDNPYYLQARYLIGTTYVKKGDLAAASTAFDALLRFQPRNDDDKDIQDLARLAQGRLFYERDQFDKAKEAYGSVQKTSKYWTDALYETIWTSIKAKDFVAAYRALDLMLLQFPDTPQAPELRLLRGNLHLRLANFYLASETFSQARDEFEPLYKELKDSQAKANADPKYFDRLLGKGVAKFDIAAFVPGPAVKWVTADPEIAKVMALGEDVGSLQKDLKDSEQTLVRLERAVTGEGKVGIFSDLARSRVTSTEILNQTVDIRRRFVGQLRAMIQESLSPEDRGELDRIRAERASYDQAASTLPTTEDALKKRESSAKGALGHLDSKASELNVTLQGMDAELVAIEQYFVRSRADMKIKAEDIKQPVNDLRAELEQTRAQLEKMRNDLTEASREFSAAGAASQSERSATVRYADLLKREQAVFQRARGRLGGGQQQQFDVINGVLTRADNVMQRLMQFDERVDAAAERRLVAIRERINAEKVELGAANQKLASVLTESQSVGGGLAQVMLGKVTDRFYDLVVQSDVGLVDVSWGIKDQKSTTLSKLINQQKLELKSVEEDFKSLLEEDKQ